MKTTFQKRLSQLSLVIVSCCMINTTHAQWSLTGNTGTSIPTNFVGTIDSVGLVFKTHNSERMRILATGDIGIGTTSPAAPLDVNGSIRGGYNTGNTSYFGYAAVGYISGQSGATFAYNGSNTATGYALLQYNANTYINALSGDGIVFRNANNNEGEWNSTGLGIGTTSPSYQLELSTNSAGKPTSSTWTVTSDMRTKTNIQAYTHGLDLIRKVRLVSFQYNGKAHTPKGEHGIGVIAQELQPIFPGSVRPFSIKADSTNPGGEFLGVDFHELFVTNIAAVQELDSMNTALIVKNISLQNQVSALQSQLSELDEQVKALQSAVSNVLGVKSILGNPSGNVIVFPNPAKGLVNIQINQGLQNGEVDIYDMDGRLISQQMNVKGNSKLNIDLSTIAKGIYVLKVKDGMSEIYSQKVVLQ